MPLPPDSRLGPYEVIRLLGAGAMGEIYVARDSRLDRLVAVKLLPESLAGDPGLAVRLRQEAIAAGALNHPNVVSVHDVGTEGNSFFVVSELIDGLTLRARLDSGAVSPALALEFVAQAARGLAAAHDKGIVHRDLKPENLMITPDDRVKIVDFGVAKVEPVARRLNNLATGPTRPGDTEPGALVGTVAYMSPEQLRGEAVDGRSDIFSLGVILYEMLAGRRPFSGATAAEVMASILRDMPSVPPRIPGPVADIVLRCLAKRPMDRFQSAVELARAAEAAFVRVRPEDQTVAALTVPGSQPGREREPGRDETVAVLPFTNLGGEPDQEYFSDGLTEQLIHELTRVRGLRVLAWHSASQLRERGDPLETARGIGADTVLVGSVRRSAGRLRVSTRLVQTATGHYLWSEIYDRDLVDLFAIQEEIARSIAATLEGTMVARQRPPMSPRRLEAYDQYLRGRYLANRRTDEGLRQSVECFERALVIDESFAAAHAGRADAYCLLADYGIAPPNQVIPKARASALRALELDARSAEAHASHALIRSLHDWQWEEAEALYRRAIEIDPGYAAAHHWLAVDLLAALGRFDEAHEEVERARQLDPLSLIIQEGKPYLLMLERRFEEAIEGYRVFRELDRQFAKAYTGTGRAYAQMGRFDDAVAMLLEGRKLAGTIPSILGALGQTYGWAGNVAAARGVLAELHALAATRYVTSITFALVHAGLGESGEAMTWLERAADLHELPLGTIKTHPAYDRLRGEPRFEALLKRMRLA